MNNQRELWLKNWGLEESGKAHQAELEQARAMARILALNGQEITIDDIRTSLPHLEYGNWCGNVFKNGEWISTGFVPARHKDSHARIVRKWRLK